jgi:tRNA(fMet)-specific endonuclease VapC
MKEKYLLDSNILIHHQRGYFNIGEYLREHDIPIEDCYISEITAIEVKVGEILLKRKGYKFNVDSDAILSNFNILPISDCIDFFVKEKCRLQFAGTPMANNFDLLIGCTAVVNNLIMVTENIKDFKNIETIKIENWISR